MQDARPQPSPLGSRTPWPVGRHGCRRTDAAHRRGPQRPVAPGRRGPRTTDAARRRGRRTNGADGRRVSSHRRGTRLQDGPRSPDAAMPRLVPGRRSRRVRPGPSARTVDRPGARDVRRRLDRRRGPAGDQQHHAPRRWCAGGRTRHGQDVRPHRAHRGDRTEAAGLPLDAPSCARPTARTTRPGASRAAIPGHRLSARAERCDRKSRDARVVRCWVGTDAPNGRRATGSHVHPYHATDRSRHRSVHDGHRLPGDPRQDGRGGHHARRQAGRDGRCAHQQGGTDGHRRDARVGPTTDRSCAEPSPERPRSQQGDPGRHRGDAAAPGRGPS